MSETDDIKEPDVPKISRRRKRFAEEYIVNGCTKSEAYRRAFGIKKGWDSQRIADNAYRVYSRPEVKAYIEHLQREMSEEYEARKHRVLAKLFASAAGDIRHLYDERGELRPITELSADASMMIASVEVEELYEGRGEAREHVGRLRKVKTVDPNRAAEVLGKMLGWVKDKVEHSGSIETPKLELVLNAPGTPSKAD